MKALCPLPPCRDKGEIAWERGWEATETQEQKGSAIATISKLITVWCLVWHGVAELTSLSCRPNDRTNGPWGLKIQKYILRLQSLSLVKDQQHKFWCLLSKAFREVVYQIQKNMFIPISNTEKGVENTTYKGVFWTNFEVFGNAVRPSL